MGGVEDFSERNTDINTHIPGVKGVELCVVNVAGRS